jgi:hypothetical protein
MRLTSDRYYCPRLLAHPAFNPRIFFCCIQSPRCICIIHRFPVIRLCQLNDESALFQDPGTRTFNSSSDSPILPANSAVETTFVDPFELFREFSSEVAHRFQETDPWKLIH